MIEHILLYTVLAADAV